VAGHWDNQWVEGREETTWTEGYWDERWIEGHSEERWVDGYLNEQWVDGYFDGDGNWNDGYWETSWVEGHSETVWIDGHSESVWVDGAWNTVWVDGYENNVWIDEYTENVWVDGYWGTTWIDGYTDSEWIEGDWVNVTIPGQWNPQGTWIPEYWDPPLDQTWVAFDEISGGWYLSSDWSPLPNTVPNGQSYVQKRIFSRDHRRGERNDAGEERNVSTVAIDTTEELRDAVGTKVAAQPEVSSAGATIALGESAHSRINSKKVLI